MWNAVRIAYFDNVKAPLLLGPVQEMVSRLRREFAVNRLMVHPHWKFGPHVDLIVECDPAMFDEQVFPACRERIESWLAQNPSQTVIDPAKYELLSQKIAMTELEIGPYLPLLDNNTVTKAAYARSEALKLPQFAVAKENFLSQALDLSLRLLRDKQGRGDECSLTLGCMMAMASQTYESGGLARGFLSYRSHAEYFFSVYDKAGALRTRFDALDASLGPRMDECLRPIARGDLATIPLAEPWKNALVEWQRLVAETAGENRRIVAENYDALVRDETFSMMAEDVSKQIPEALLSPERQKAPSAVWVAAQHAIGQRVLNSPEFLSYRTTVNFFYMLLPILELSPAQKFCLCHIVAKSCERIFSTTWQELMGVGIPESRDAR